MTVANPGVLEDPLAEIERHLMEAYAAGAGHDLGDLLRRTDDAARTLLADASRYASGRLSEIEARSHYLHAMRGDA
jgi:hypothetical protein